MLWLRRLERRVSLPGDSETERTKKSLVPAIALAGSVLTLFNAVPLFSGGLDAAAWTYIASAVYILLGALMILAWPQSFRIISFALLLDVMIFPGIAQVLVGGYRSGMQIVPWAVFAPIGAALVLSARETIVHMALCALTIILVALAEPYAQTIAPEISDRVLLSFNVSGLISLGLLLTAASLVLVRQMERFRAQADGLLLNILPAPIATRLKSRPQTIADEYDCVSVVFADLVDFTRLSADAQPEEMVELMNDIFSTFDALAARHGLEKIKTIGDAYMAAAGLPGTRTDHTEAVADFALDALAAVQRHEGFHGETLQVRIGINRGPVVAGVIGQQKFAYDMWGDTVNVASRMTTNSPPNEIQVTADVREALEVQYYFREREPMAIKGKGLMVLYLLQGRE